MSNPWGFTGWIEDAFNELAFWVLIGRLILYVKWIAFLELNNL